LDGTFKVTNRTRRWIKCVRLRQLELA
jgi:hypothetical protein